MQIISDIDVAYHIDKTNFEKRYLIPQKPLVIKGLIEDKVAGKRWSIDYFKTTMGDLTVDVYDNSMDNNGSAYTSADLKMKFQDFLNVIEKDEHTGLRMFLFNLFKYNPELKKEFPCPDIIKGLMDGFGYTFFAGKNTSVRIHYDIDMSNVLHTQVVGKKRVVLISPEYNELLYRLPLNTYSLVNIDNPDYEKYPGLRYINGSVCILEAGDSIFIPSGYWHFMNYLDGGISVAYRKLAYSNRAKMQGLQNLIFNMPIDKLFGALAGEKWQNFKELTATRRANKILLSQQYVY